MAENVNHLFEQLLTALQASEKRHRAVRDNASDNSEWELHDREVEIISKIISWRRNLEALRSEVVGSGTISNDDIVLLKTVSNSISETTNDTNSIVLDNQSAQYTIPSFADDERIGRYVREKMKELSDSKYRFTDDDLVNLQNAQWCYQVLNLPCQFFLRTKREVRNYWKRDLFKFNGIQFRLCLLWYNGLYRGRSQRECFDAWYNSLSTSNATIETDDEIKVGRHIRSKLSELSVSGYVFSDEQIQRMCDVDWSRETFAYNYRLPFAKLVDMQQNISDQTKDENGRNRYWNEVFTFGKHNLLFFSQWYAKDRMLFDKWYAELTHTSETVVRDTLLFEKTAESSNTLDVDSAITKPTRFVLLGKEYPVNTWEELFIKVCETLLLCKPYIIATVDKDNELNAGISTIFSYLQADIKGNGRRLSNGLWIETDINNRNIQDTCHKLLKKCGLSPDEIEITTAEVD